MSNSEIQPDAAAAPARTTRFASWMDSFDKWIMPRPRDGQIARDTQVQVHSPENIAFNYRAAGPFPRFFAFIIDVIICGAIFFAFYILMGLFGLLLSAVGLGSLVGRLMMVSDAIISVAIFGIWWFYAAILETWMNGQTLAKRFLGLRVLSVDGNPVGGLQATLRAIIRTVEVMPFVTLQIFDPWIRPLFEDVPGSNGEVPPIWIFPTFLVGLVTMALTRRFQRIGDLVCGTMVVREVRTWGHGLANLEDPRAPHLAEYIPTSFVFGQSLTKALAAYVDRRRYFSLPRRTEIAKHIAEPLLERFGLPTDTSYDLFLCALYYRAFIADQGKQDAIDLKLNVQERRFEGFVPEHQLQALHSPTDPAVAPAEQNPSDPVFGNQSGRSTRTDHRN